MRCAIYTRKSGEDRPDTSFGSLDNQRLFCSAYIASQAGEGWYEMPDHYDDGGFSGGNLERPALRRLREDVRQQRIDHIVVYKIDRLSRSLRDFCNLIAEFEARGVTFVSVTQSFDTRTAMGRLTLNVLLSFAQFERELTSERLRDSFAGARGRGLWTQQRPYGYRKEPGSKRLVPDEAEAEVVRWMFRRYLKLRSANKVAAEAFDRGLTNTRGRPWSGNMVRHVVKHPVYIGHLVHRGRSIPGTHAPIVSAALWRRAAVMIEAARIDRESSGAKCPIPLLKGLLVDRTGAQIIHTFVNAKGKLYRYYIAQQERRHGYGEGSDPYMRFRADEMEQGVISVVSRMTGRDLGIIKTRSELQERIRRHVRMIKVAPDQMIIEFWAGGEVVTQPCGQMGARRRIRRAPRPPSSSVRVPPVRA
ncbi:recombinase family protein [Haematobacter sp. UBA3484]|uniref:recombinase family protein n=1 Tax=Haematobacter sp. UBA3484 TaxID=1946582 RepID=UPI0039C874F1